MAGERVIVENRPAERHLVARRRLVEDVLAVPDAALIEAAGGFGKTVLVQQLASEPSSDRLALRLPRGDSVERDELKALMLDARRPDPVSNRPRVAYEGDVGVQDLVDSPGGDTFLVIDNVQSLTGDAASWLARLAHDGPPALRLVVAGRMLPQSLQALEFDGSAVRFDTDDLRLTPEESRAIVSLELGADDADRLWSALHHFSGGWVALLCLVVRRILRASDRVAAASDLLKHPALIGQLLDYYLTEIDPRDRELFTQIAHFPMVNESIVDALGLPGLLRRLSDAGIPFAVGPDGWWRLPSTIKEHMVAQGALDHEFAIQAAPLLVAQGAELAAAGLLADSGDNEAAASLISQLPTSRIDALDPGVFMRLITRLGSAADANPRVLLYLARSHGHIGHFAEEREIIERGLRAVHGSDLGEDSIAIEIEAEMLYQTVRLDATSTTDRIQNLLADVDEGTRAHARLLEALGVILADRPDEASLRRAENAMRQATIIWGEHGDLFRSAAAKRGLAVRVLAALGEFGAAATLLDRLAATSETSYERMLCLVLEARVLALAGEGERAEAVLTETVSLAEFLGIEWVIGYAGWSRMLVAANDEDQAKVLQQLVEVEAHMGQLGDGAGGVLFLCEAADACALVGKDAQAQRLLEAARHRRDEDPRMVAITEACMAARLGEPGAAAVLGEILDNEQAAPWLRWKVELLRAFGELSTGHPEAAHRLLPNALDYAALIGHPELPDRRERGVVDILRSAITTSAETIDCSGDSEEYEVTVLGGFEIRRGGEVLPSPPGRPAELVKHLAAAGGSSQIETVVEVMWPDEAPGVGQRRLKNVLSRCRAAYGPLVVRTGTRLSLSRCRVDLSRLEQQVSQVVASREAERVEMARVALDSYTGTLLPDDLYDDLIGQRRQALRRRVLGLIDVVLAADLAAGDLNDAIAMQHAAMEHDPYDQERAIRVVRALVDAGRDLEARNLAAQLLATAEELGVPAPVECDELAARGRLPDATSNP